MRKRSGRKTLIIVCVLAAAVICLIAAGTVLRMQTHSMGFFDALTSFLSDTFDPYKN